MSTTTNLKLFKHDNPTTNTDQFDVEKALNENWDKLDENAGEIANKIQTLENTTNEKYTSQDTEIQALKAENTLLKSQIPSATVVGRTIHLDNSSNMQCQIMPLGASIQVETPSIDSESPIESVGDNINLFDIETVEGNKFIYANSGQLGTSSVTSTSNFIKVEANKSYELSFDYETLLSTTDGAICLFDDNKTYLSGISYTKSNKKASITPTQNGYLRFCYDNNCTDIKITKGTSTGAYSPYGQGSIEICNCNKNLCPQAKCTVTETGHINTSNGSYGNVKAGQTYTISFKNNRLGTNTFNLTIRNYYDTGIHEVVTNITIGLLDSYSAKFTASKNGYIVFSANPTSIEALNEIFYDIQLELGTEATEYVPHQAQTKALYTQQPLKAIGEVKDRFVKKDGIWYEEHKIGRYIFTGNENWMKNDSWTNQNAFFGTVNWNPKLVDGFVTIANLICSHLTIVTPHKVSIMSGSAIGQGAGNTIYISMEGVTTSAELKAKLSELYNAGTPLYVDYVLAEPLLIPCTPEQVEVLEGFNTYKNVTNISSDSIGELEVTYSKDLETLYNNLSQAVWGGN